MAGSGHRWTRNVPSGVQIVGRKAWNTQREAPMSLYSALQSEAYVKEEKDSVHRHCRGPHPLRKHTRVRGFIVYPAAARHKVIK
ncbi:NADH-quinone oxidoreductase subunit D [Frankliniella fusca]|uniref:NADH-quinone oxidoreductase subunit D n=1 Tax=Frankliniella fusca TaxID=407009 RepID=A0AAE1LJV6_9NEOP|nr:NADH-quinone oxidoreductase subunit D [Frankliniella fusca]